MDDIQFKLVEEDEYNNINSYNLKDIETTVKQLMEIQKDLQELTTQQQTPIDIFENKIEQTSALVNISEQYIKEAEILSWNYKRLFLKFTGGSVVGIGTGILLGLNPLPFIAAGISATIIFL